MIALLAAVTVVALISLGAYIHVANERDYLSIEVANLEYRLKCGEGPDCDSDS